MAAKHFVRVSSNFLCVSISCFLFNCDLAIYKSRDFSLVQSTFPCGFSSSFCCIFVCFSCLTHCILPTLLLPLFIHIFLDYCGWTFHLIFAASSQHRTLLFLLLFWLGLDFQKFRLFCLLFVMVLFFCRLFVVNRKEHVKKICKKNLSRVGNKEKNSMERPVSSGTCMWTRVCLSVRAQC